MAEAQFITTLDRFITGPVKSIQDDERVSPAFATLYNQSRQSTCTRDQARLFLASCAISRLYRGGPFTLRELIQVPKALEDNPPKSLVKEGHSKSWQRRFMNELIGAGLVEKVGNSNGTQYQMYDEKLLGTLVSNIIMDDGLVLKKILWPNDYEINAVKSEDEGEEYEDEEEEGENATPSEESFGSNESLLSLVQEITAQLITMAQNLTTVSQNSQEILAQVKETANEVKGTLARVQEAAENQETGMALVQEEISKLRAEMLDEDRKALLSLSVVLSETGARNKSIMNQLEAKNRKEDETVRALEAVLSRVQAKLGGKSGAS